MSLLSLIIFIVVIGLVIYLLETLPLPPPFKLIIRVAAILIAIVWLLQVTGFGDLRIR